MSEIIKYYSNFLNNLNKKYDEYTKNYVEEFVNFKILPRRKATYIRLVGDMSMR
jgi:CRISPR/Cas system endoribonuclease Cas6 (RAMP superfamily)